MTHWFMTRVLKRYCTGLNETFYAQAISKTLLSSEWGKTIVKASDVADFVSQISLT